MERTVTRVLAELDIILDESGRRRLLREALHQQQYSSKHVTSQILSLIGYTDDKIQLDYGTYMDFFLPARHRVDAFQLSPSK
jgi:hypothetical protein